MVGSWTALAQLADIARNFFICKVSTPYFYLFNICIAFSICTMGFICVNALPAVSAICIFIKHVTPRIFCEKYFLINRKYFCINNSF